MKHCPCGMFPINFFLCVAIRKSVLDEKKEIPIELAENTNLSTKEK